MRGAMAMKPSLKDFSVEDLLAELESRKQEAAATAARKAEARAANSVTYEWPKEATTTHQQTQQVSATGAAASEQGVEFL